MFLSYLCWRRFQVFHFLNLPVLGIIVKILKKKDIFTVGVQK